MTSWAVRVTVRPIIAAAVVGYLFFVTVVRLPLMWDGSYYVFRILDEGRPFVVYDRYSVVPLHLPTLLVGRLSGSVDAASYVFSFTYALVPVLAAALAWYWHRNVRTALLWSIIGITVSVLPAQAFSTSEAVIATQLWWPLFLLAASGRWRERPWSALIVTIIIFGLHPLAIFLLALLAVAVAVRPRISALGLSVAAAVLLAGAWRAIALAGYESNGLPSLSRAVSRGGYVNSAAFGLLALAVAIAAVRSIRPERSPSALNTLMWACIVGSAVLHVVAAFDLVFLSQAAGGRFALVSSTVVFAVLASMHVVRKRTIDVQPLTVVTAAGVAVYLLYMMVAGVAWQHLVTNRVDPFLAGQVHCVDIDTETSFHQTPLATWSTSSLSVVLQGRTPTHLFLPYSGCDTARPDAPVLLLDAEHGGTRDRHLGWFDLSRAGLR